MLTIDDTRLLKDRLSFWDNITEQEQNYLIENSRCLTYEKGQTLHRGDLDCIGVLLIVSGSLRTFITSDEGREVTLYRLGESDFCVLSASCILHDITFDVSIEAETDCQVIQVNSIALSKLSVDNVYVELFTYKIAAERFSDVMWAMEQILFTSFDRRLATFLYDESIKNQDLTLHMTHEQIAKHLGTAREVVSRMLKYFSSEGLVTLARGGITIVDASRLFTYTQ